jgi:hypothetical protein
MIGKWLDRPVDAPVLATGDRRPVGDQPVNTIRLAVLVLPLCVPISRT